MVNKMADLKNKLQAKATGTVKQVSPNQGMKQMYYFAGQNAASSSKAEV